MDCYLKGKTFYGREWIFQKLQHCLQLKSPGVISNNGAKNSQNSSDTVSGVLITGNSGTGKSAICAELVHPTVPGSVQSEDLSGRILAYHFCQSHDFDSLTPARFVHSLANQIMSCADIGGRSSPIANQIQAVIDVHPQLKMLMDPNFCAKYPTQCAQTLAKILRDLPAPKESLILLIDSVHETQIPVVNYNQQNRTGHSANSQLSSQRTDTRNETSSQNPENAVPGKPPTGSCGRSTVNGGRSSAASKSIAALIGQIAPLLPDWLLLVCTARRHWSGSNRIFGSFRKLVLDDLKKTSVIRDTQSYILRRIDDDSELYDLLVQKPETAELLNQLHIKSAGCLLYLEKILDGLIDGLLKLSELAHIPGTLNGLYLWLCQRIFSKKQFELVRPALNVLLASNCPLSRKDLKSCWILRRLDDNPALFDQVIMKLMKRVLIPLPSPESGSISDTANLQAMSMTESDLMEQSITSIDYRSEEDQVILFHNSFAEWLRDVKHCTQRYLCSFTDGQHSLAMLYSAKAPNLSPSELVYFCQCLDRTMPKDTDPAVLQAWLLQSGVDLDSFRSLPTTDDIPPAFLPILPSSPSEGSSSESENSGESEILKYFASIHSDLTTSSSLSSGGGAGHGTSGSGGSGAIDTRSMSQMSSQSGGGFQTQSQFSTSSSLPPLSPLDALIQASREGWDSKIQSMLSHINASKSGVNMNMAATYDNPPGTFTGGSPRMITNGSTFTSFRMGSENGAQNNQISLGSTSQPENSSQTQILTTPDCTDSEGWTPLRGASWAGHVSTVELLLSHGATVDFADDSGRTALRAAAWAGHDRIVLILLNHGADINKTDCQGRTALMAACYMGHIDIIQILLDHGADANLLDLEDRPAISLFVLGCTGSDLVTEPDYLATLRLLLGAMQHCDRMLNAFDKLGSNVLFHLAFEGSPDACDLLIECGADPEIACGPEALYPVHAAASTGNRSVFDSLLRHGASIDAVDSEGRTVLSLAAAGGKPDMVRYLLEKGLDELHRDNHGWIALHHATVENKSEVVRVLCSHNPSTVSEIDREGRHPLILAAEEGAQEAAQTLLEFNPPINQSSLSGFNPLRVACLTSRKSLAELLISKGADPDLVDLDGRSSLFVMVLQKIPAMAEYLLSQGSSPDAKDLLGRTPLHVAAYLGQVDLVDLLLKWGANVNALDEARRTPLLTATWQGEFATCKLLLDYSAKPDMACKEGATALHVAAQLGREDLARLLLQHSADHAILDSFSRTPAAVAELAGFEKISKLLSSGQGGAHQTVVSQTSSTGQNSSGIGTGLSGMSAGRGRFTIAENKENEMLEKIENQDQIENSGGLRPDKLADNENDPIDHIIADVTNNDTQMNSLNNEGRLIEIDHPSSQGQIGGPQNLNPPLPPPKTSEKFNTHSSSLSNYTLSSSASLGSNGISAAMENSAVFTQCLLERSHSQKRNRTGGETSDLALLARSACSEPNQAQNAGAFLYNNSNHSNYRTTGSAGNGNANNSMNHSANVSNTGSLSPPSANGAYLYRNRPRIITNPRCRMRPSQDFRTS